MADVPNHGAQEPLAVQVALRRDLEISSRDYHGRSYYIIEDPLRSKFFRVGGREFTFISLLDGNTPISEALGLAAEVTGRDALTEKEALAICRWLVDSQLASTIASAHHTRLSDVASRNTRRDYRARFNPLFVKLPLINPDLAVQRLFHWCGWIFSWQWFLLWAALCTWSCAIACRERDQLAVSSDVIFDTANLWRLAAAWLILKVLHETAHALVCKKYGGCVASAGIALMFLAPLAFVDVTSSWRFRSKWHRIATAAAGMYVELFIAAIAILVWAQTYDGEFHRLAYNIAVMASFSTLVFNGNPLLRFDGYFILADFLEVPNLSSSGRQYLMYLVARYVCGLNDSPPAWPSDRATVVKLYGVAAMAFRFVLSLAILLALAGTLSHVGIVLAIVIGIVWFGVPLWRDVRQLAQRTLSERSNPQRCLTTAASMVIAATAIAFILSRPARLQAPAVVDYAPVTVVRAGVSGFVLEVPVQSGENVNAGDVIAILENEALQQKKIDLALELQISSIKSRGFHQNSELAKYQIENANRAGLEKKMAEIDKELELLTIRAATSGCVAGRNLESLVGRYLRAGDELAVIGTENAKELVVAISQDDVDYFPYERGNAVEISLRGGPDVRITAALARVSPRAAFELPHPALSARVGGPLAVKPKSDETTEADKTHFELLSPRFCGTVPLSAADSGLLRAGQVATVYLNSPSQTTANHLYTWAVRWIESRINRREQ